MSLFRGSGEQSVGLGHLGVMFEKSMGTIRECRDIKLRHEKVYYSDPQTL